MEGVRGRGRGGARGGCGATGEGTTQIIIPQFGGGGPQARGGGRGREGREGGHGRGGDGMGAGANGPKLVAN